MQKKIVGVLGGMGPDATVDFMSKVISKTNQNNASLNKAGADQDHIRMLIDHNPTVPNRNDAIRQKKNNEEVSEDVGDHLANMAKRLENANADFLVMVCNTAHAFKADIEQAVKIPFVSIIDEVTDELINTQARNTKVGIMAAQGCLDSELYQQSISEAGFEVVIWNEDELADFMQIVYKIKGGDISDQVKEDTLAMANILIDKGAEVILAGCTEIPLVLHEDQLRVQMLASTDILVDRVIDYCLGNKSI
jgi:aspartate racemase